MLDNYQDVLTLDEVCQILRINRKTLRYLINSGQLPTAELAEYTGSAKMLYASILLHRLLTHNSHKTFLTHYVIILLYYIGYDSSLERSY